MTAIVTMKLSDLRGLSVYARDALIRDNRTQIQGVHFRPAEDGAEAVASNGRGLALLSLPAAAVEGTLPDAGITLPAATVLLFKEDEGTVRLSLGGTCSIEHGDRLEKAAPVALPYPDYRAVLPETAAETATSALHFSARELNLAATALRFFAIGGPSAWDTAAFRFLRPEGPHELHLRDRDDVRLIFMPCRPPESPPSSTETPE